MNSLLEDVKDANAIFYNMMLEEAEERGLIGDKN